MRESATVTSGGEVATLDLDVSDRLRIVTKLEGSSRVALACALKVVFECAIFRPASAPPKLCAIRHAVCSHASATLP